MSGKLIKHINSKVNIVIIIVFTIMVGVSYLIWYERKLRKDKQQKTTTESYARENSIAERLSLEKGLLTLRQKDLIIDDSKRNENENIRNSARNSVRNASETLNPDSFTLIDESAISNEYSNNNSSTDTESIEDLVYNTPDEVYNSFNPEDEQVIKPQGNPIREIVTYQNYPMDKSLPSSLGDQRSQMYNYS
jgi:hypothetical protein